MKIQGNKLIPTSGVYTNPADYFLTADLNSLSENVIIFWGEVVDYPKDNSTPGAITFRLLGIHSGITDEPDMQKRLYVAYPANPCVFTKPVPGQIVCIIENSNGIYYYLGTLQAGNNANGTFSYEVLSRYVCGIENKSNTSANKSNLPTKQSNQTKIPYDIKEFKIIDKVIPAIKEKAGDTIIRGMFNNDIALTYNKDGRPKILIIVDRQTNETDNNTSGILLQVDEEVDSKLKYACNIKDNIEKETGGVSLVINSDSIRINNRKNSVYVSSNGKIVLSCNKDYCIDTQQNVRVNAKEIYLGKNASEMLVLGNKLQDWLSSLIDGITALTVGTAVGASTPPINSATFVKLKAQLNSILSKTNRTS